MNHRFRYLLAMSVIATCLLHDVSRAQPDESRAIGVNLAGAEFGRVPGVFNQDYTYPGERQFDYCQRKGLRVIRLPFKWERIQPQLNGPLDSAELHRLDEVVKLAGDRDLRLLLDMHNYARYQGKVIGTAEVPNAAFADVWQRLAEHYRSETAVFAYGIMNEPHGTNGRWPAAAQAAVDAIRSVDRQHTILVCGDGWSGAHSWRKINENLLLEDPADNLVYEAHQYFDRDNSGSYKRSYDGEGATPETGVDRLQPFITWLEEHNRRGFLGEFGVPDNDPRWLVVLDNTLAEMQKHQIGGTYWAAGPWWGDYPLGLEPRDGQDRPQMAVIERYLGLDTGATGAAVKPWVAAAAAAEAAAQRAREADARWGRRVHDFGDKKESYHYSNEGSEFASQIVDADGRRVCKITYRHHGNPAWIGVGVYFGSLNCQGYDPFHLDVRADQACRLEIKAYDTDGKRHVASYDVGLDWQTLTIPFADLKADGEALTGAKPIQKIEFQPSTSQTGNALYLGALRLQDRRTPAESPGR